MAKRSYPLDSQENRLAKLQSLPANHTGPITFGVEIEANLAFKQSKLQSILNRYYKGRPVIVKAFPDSAHDCFLNEDDLSHKCRNLYPSWVLEVAAEADTSLQLVAQQSTTITGRPGKVRRYLAEPLIIAREALGNTTVPVDIKAQLRRGQQTITLGQDELASSVVLRTHSADYRRWTLTTDHTLIGCLDNQLIAAVGSEAIQMKAIKDPDGTTRNIREKQWDSAGFELVSPIFDWSDKVEAFKALKQCMTRLSHGPDHQTVSSKWASLQVHIGLDVRDPDMIPLLTLQHLAYILICHEDLLSKLHPRSRCGLPLKANTKETEEFQDSEDIDIEEYHPDAPPLPEPTPAEIAAEDELYLNKNNELVLATEKRYTGYNTTNSNARYFCHTTFSTYPPNQEQVGAYIFQSGMTLPQLVSLLQKPSTRAHDAAKGHRYRGYMYNFDNLLTMYLEDSSSWKTGKPTIEFRQHACSTNPKEIRKWVELCFAIVNFAHQMAERESSLDEPNDKDLLWTTQTNKYPDASHWPCKTIDSFLGADFLGLDQQDIQCWTERYRRYKDDRPTEEEVDDKAF